MSLGPLFMDEIRATWMDYSTYVTMGTFRILAARGRPEVEPWSFLFPLSTLVWVAILLSMLAVVSVMLLLYCLFFHKTQKKAFICIRVFLQQGIDIFN